MGQLVGSGASLLCSFGTGPSTLNATSPRVKGPSPAGIVTDITRRTSTCQCAWGGVISVTQPGQATVTV